MSTSAAHEASGEVVRMLLDANADVNFRDSDHGTPLQAACECGNNEVVRILLDADADVNAPGGGGGKKPMRFMRLRGQVASRWYKYS
jgi:ankyrin repeat protein